MDTITTDRTAEAFTVITAAAGGRHRGFLLARLYGWSNKEIEAACGNRPGTVAFALSAMRKKAGVTGTAANGWGLTETAVIMGLPTEAITA